MTTVRRRQSLLGRLQSLVRAKDGRLTRELGRAPGRFGLGQVPAGKTPDATTGMVCGFCSTGCGLTVHLRDGAAINLSPTTDYPVNRGMACPKGWEALTVLDALDRATIPLLRGDDGRPRPVEWHDAMLTMAARFRAIQAEHGAESVAFLSTGQIATEEMALLGAIAKFGMGMVHGDGNTRQCMASAVVAYKQAFGFDAPPYTYQDLEESDCIVLIGANPCIAHPVLWERVTRNPHSPDIIVVDPRRTETAMAATLHLPVRPKSDLTLPYGLAHLLIEQGAIDRSFIAAHTQGFDEFAAFVRRFDPELVARETGLNADVIADAAGRIARRERVSFWWTMGVNQSHQGVKTAQAAINLALLTGNIGRPGTGANSITGQCNAMGSRLFSNTTSLLGGRDFTNPAHRAEVSTLLGIPEERIPQRPSWSYDGIIEGIRAGTIRGLWVVATNPAHSWVDQGELRETLGKLDELGGVQWPYPAENPDASPQRRLFSDGRFFHPDGRARFLFAEPKPLPEPPDVGFPFQLLTGRGSAAQWHTQTRTAKSDVLRKLHPPDPYVEINPADAKALHLTSGGWAVVESRRGSARARAFVTPTVPAGQLFLPMHDGSTNLLTLSAFDPESRQPAYKSCAVRIRPARNEEVSNDPDAVTTH